MGSKLGFGPLFGAFLEISGWQPGEGTSELIEEVHHGASDGVPVASFRPSGV